MNKKRFSLSMMILLIVMATVFGVALTAQAATVCTPTSTISVPYAKDGAGDLCFQTSDLCSYINSWNLSTLEVNGTPYTNTYVASSSITPLNGMYIIHYVSSVAWGHFEIGGTCSGGNPTPTRTNTPVSTFTPTITPTIPSGNLPDLTITSAYWTWDPNAYNSTDGCYYYTPILLMKVTVKNNGTANAGTFVVDQNGVTQQTVTGGLAVGQTVDLWFPFTFSGGASVFTADSTHLIVESNESNNSYSIPNVAFTATPSGLPRVYCTPTTTPTPTITITPTSQGSVTGSVLIHGGGCCMGGPVGSVIGIDVAFSATSTVGAVTDMRVDHLSCGNSQDLSAASWEPFTTSQTYLHTIATINWYGYYTRAQYRDSLGNLSPIYCDDISIEGMPPVTVTGGTPTASCGTVVVATLTPTPTYTPTPKSATATTTPSCHVIYVTPTPSGPTLTPTRTPTVTLTPTRTPTLSPTPTTPTPSGGTCNPVDATIVAPFTKDGAGNLCWQSSNLGSYINSWNTTSVTLNGVNVTNVYVGSGSYPAKINGYWYVTYNGPYAWSHFEAK